jgi:hypothetical protein
MSTESDKELLDRLWSYVADVDETATRLEERVGNLRETVAELKTQAALVKIPERPCDQFKSHLQDHDRVGNRWWDVFLRFAGYVLAALVGAAAARLDRR